jgi:vancomycin resistance protein YoaR
VRVLAPGRAGQQVSPAAVNRALTASLQLPVTEPVRVMADVLPPASSETAARSVNALLGTFTTPFSCCPPRVTNIRLIARTVDGTLIGPGQSFSLNGVVGRRTKAKGYVEAPFILDGELSSDVGGGVSQFATTTLNAAFFAGLRLDRHQAHSFYISRYPAGREATVNYPSIDLRWTNTTSAPVLVRASTTANSLTVALYGAADGRTVQAIAGPRRPVPGRDFRIVVERIVTLPGRAAQRESFTTTYNKPPRGE